MTKTGRIGSELTAADTGAGKTRSAAANAAGLNQKLLNETAAAIETAFRNIVTKTNSLDSHNSYQDLRLALNTLAFEDMEQIQKGENSRPNKGLQTSIDRLVKDKFKMELEEIKTAGSRFLLMVLERYPSLFKKPLHGLGVWADLGTTRNFDNLAKSLAQEIHTKLAKINPENYKLFCGKTGRAAGAKKTRKARKTLREGKGHTMRRSVNEGPAGRDAVNRVSTEKTKTAPRARKAAPPELPNVKVLKGVRK